MRATTTAPPRSALASGRSIPKPVGRTSRSPPWGVRGPMGLRRGGVSVPPAGLHAVAFAQAAGTRSAPRRAALLHAFARRWHRRCGVLGSIHARAKARDRPVPRIHGQRRRAIGTGRPANLAILLVQVQPSRPARRDSMLARGGKARCGREVCPAAVRKHPRRIPGALSCLQECDVLEIGGCV